jgi:phosphonate transport system substrate-binding protein
MAVVPLLAPERSIEAYQALARYLGAKLGRPTELVVRTSQADASELVRARQVDLAFVDAYAFVRGEREFGMRVVAAPSSRGRPTYQSYIVARRSSATGSLLDARGARFASADLLSSSGWLFPATWLTAHGEDPRRFFSRIITTGSDDQSLDLVVSGQADAASVSSMVYDRVAAEGTLVANTTRVVQHSPSIATPPVVAHPEMDADLLRRVRATLVAMDADPDGRKALDGVGFDGFVVPERGLYDSIRTMAAERERP